MNDTSNTSPGVLAAVGDVHGHLQLALCVLARWQQELGVRFEAALLCGDVGTFTEESQLDSATRRHAKANPAEIEFLRQWSTRPQAPWLDAIFEPIDDGGLGLTCPVLMVHGNHEGFSHLERIVPAENPSQPVAPDELPAVDTNRHVRLVPSGWRVRLASGRVVAAVGGIQPGQRRADYHPMAYISEEAVLALMDGPPVDVLITHQGPSSTQDEVGSELLQPLLDEGVASVWFHGHSIRRPEIRSLGRKRSCQVVPLGDIPFQAPREQARFREPYQPGSEGWAWLEWKDRAAVVHRDEPGFLREFYRHHWLAMDDMLISPTLVQEAWETMGRWKE